MSGAPLALPPQASGGCWYTTSQQRTKSKGPDKSHSGPRHVSNRLDEMGRVDVKTFAAFACEWRHLNTFALVYPRRTKWPVEPWLFRSGMLARI